LPRWLYPSLIAVVTALFVLSLATGRAGGAGVFALLAGSAGDPQVAWLILSEVRAPRAVLGVLVGATLGLAGAALQGYLRNPLAEPSLVGASATGALGSVLVIYLGAAGATSLAAPLGGVAGALAGLGLVLLLAGRDATPLTLILAGVAVNSLAAALTSLTLNLAPSPYAVLEIVFWLLGSLADRSRDHVLLALPFMLTGAAMMLAARRALDALSLGEEAAWTLGFGARRTRVLVIGGAGVALGAAVAVSGSIGFVGLVVPHLLRPLVGHRPGALLAPSALGGAALTLAADVVVRVIPSDVELKLGVITALAGAPLFLWLLHRMRRELL
jgi:iron complex transport system permease protein